MDDSIMIIGEVPPDPNYVPPPDIEVISENPQSKAGPAKHTRPVRTRKPVKTLREELEDEQEKKVSKRPVRRKLATISSGPVLTGQKAPPKPSVKRKEPPATLEPAKPTKAIKIESGGAGSMNNKRKIPQDDDIQIVFEWDPASVISERQGVEEWQARSVINMFDKENTLPFIARYRKEKTGFLEVEKLREIQNAYTQLKTVKEKVAKVMKSDNICKLEIDQRQSLLRATTMHEVDHLTAPLKTTNKRSYAERAKELGLEEPAKRILKGLTTNPRGDISRADLVPLIDQSTEGLSSLEEIEQGVQHILADTISKDPKVLDFVRQLMRSCKPMMECNKKKITQKDDKKKNTSAKIPIEAVVSKYQNYFNFKNYAFFLRPHQILAINRGENQCVLSVKVNIPDCAYTNFFNFCRQNFNYVDRTQGYRNQILIRSFEDSWERLVKPFMQRQIRSQLTEIAEIASVEVFTSNLKKLLLTPPVRGKTVLAIDPGFLNGCKIGVTNPKGDKILVTTIFPFFKNKQKTQMHWSKDHNAITLREIVQKHGCEYFAIGNGTACRQMEEYVSNLITSDCFSPFNVQYTIVNESGASQYSITPEARAELPGMEPNHISAIALARRLQDPLLEYVKVHPMHLGVGMYQHDIPEKLLHLSLDSVMTECVSFVGVDINVASEFVLRKLSGLSKVRAAHVVEYRTMKGPFTNRQQLMDVKGIGPVTFEQCSGFIRIMPETLEAQIKSSPKGKKKAQFSTCPLDRTLVHPESYEPAIRFVKLVNLNLNDVGTEKFIKKICHYSQNSSLEIMAKQCSTTVATMQLIIEGLSLGLDFDIRAQFEKPLFRKGIISIDDLKPASKVSGTVRNVTDFGAFVDIGVGQDALIHMTKMCGMRVELGSIVEAIVVSIDKNRGRIGLELSRVQT